MNSISPVFKDQEDKERVLALDQQEYFPIIIHVTPSKTQGIYHQSVRFEFTEEERQKIADGADLVISELNGFFVPIATGILFKDESWEFD